MSAEVAFLNPEGLSQPPGYSHVVTARGGTTVYISGQGAFDAAGNIVGEGDHRRQAEQVFANLGLALAAAGAGFEHLVKLTYYVVDLRRKVTLMLREVRTGYLSQEHPPASTLVAVPALVDPRLLLEVEAVAVIPYVNYTVSCARQTVTMHRISHQSYHPGTWSGGTTRAIWAEPLAALTAPATARWWVGTAVIERDAQYSHFAGRHRLHLPIHGQGLRLRFRNPPEEVTLAPGVQHQFNGERYVEAALVDGPVTAFNLIYQVGVVATADVVIVEPGGLVLPLRAPEDGPADGTREPVRVIYTIAGALTAHTDDGQQATLERDDSVVIIPDAGAGAPPQVRLTTASGASAEVVLATLWLPKDTVA